MVQHESKRRLECTERIKRRNLKEGNEKCTIGENYRNARIENSNIKLLIYIETQRKHRSI